MLHKTCLANIGRYILLFFVVVVVVVVVFSPIDSISNLEINFVRND